MRLFACVLALGLSASAWGQAPPNPSPNPGPSPQSKQTPAPQQPQTQLYRLVPVDAPAQPQYQTVQVQQPVYQTVQVAQQPVQQAVYTTGLQATLGVAPVANRTVVLGPGLVGLSLARVGQTMVNTFGKSHIWQISHTTVAPQIQPAPPVQLVSVSLPQPVAQPPVYVQVPQPPTQQVLINAPSEAAPPPPVIQQIPKASPQSSTVPPPKHHLFGMLGSN